jgi:hypothetical protein
MSEKVAFSSEMTRWIAGENIIARETLIPNDFSKQILCENHVPSVV